MQTQVRHLTKEELEAGLPRIQESPKHQGVLEMIVCRPAKDVRESLLSSELNHSDGLVGDNWKARGSSRTPDGSADPNMQLTIMNSRTVDLVAQSKDRWGLAGDQLFVDLDLSEENMPAGTRLALGAAVVEITPEPHTGCKKFLARFGLEAMKFVNSPVGIQLHLRGVNARVVQPGVVRVGDVVKKV
jgi:hypothetical protein